MHGATAKVIQSHVTAKEVYPSQSTKQEMKITIFWDVTLWRPVQIYQHLEAL